MQNIKIQFIHNRRKKLLKNGTAPLELTASFLGDRVIKSLGIYLKSSEWDAQKQQVKGNSQKAFDLNNQLLNIQSEINQLQLRNRVAGKAVSAGLVNELFQQKAPTDLIQFIKSEIDQSQNGAATISSYNNTLNHVTAFLGSKSIGISEVDFNFYFGLEGHLRKSLSTNTVHKVFKNLKVFLKLAEKRGLIKEFSNYTIRKEAVNKRVLTLAEVNTIATLKFEEYETTLRQSRDMFLFACYTGLRISDVIRLKIEWFSCDEKGWHAQFKTHKVKKVAKLDLRLLFPNGQEFSRPEMILQEYMSRHEYLVFPPLAEATINRMLKVVATLAEIPSVLTFHKARDFFGTHMSTKLPLPTVMRLMQHSDIKTTMHYVGISEQMIEEGLLKVDW